MPSAAAFARISDSVMPPAATAAPSVFTASPIHAAATSGSCDRKVCARNGRISTSITANTTTSDDTRIGTRGRARIAPPVAIAAETPQIEMPDASGAAHSRLKPNHLRGDEIDDRPVDQIGLDDRRDATQHQRRSQA